MKKQGQKKVVNEEREREKKNINEKVKKAERKKRVNEKKFKCDVEAQIK